MSNLKNAFKSFGTAVILGVTTMGIDNADAGQTPEIVAPNVPQSVFQAKKGAPTFTKIAEPLYNNLPKPMVTSKDFLNAKPDTVEIDGETEIRTFNHKNGSKTMFFQDAEKTDFPHDVCIVHYNDKGEITHEVSYNPDEPNISTLTVYKDGNYAASFVGGMPKTDLFATPTPIKVATYKAKDGSTVGIHFKGDKRTEICVIQPDGKTRIYNFGKDGIVSTETLLNSEGNVIHTIGNENNFGTNIPPFTKGQSPSR